MSRCTPVHHKWVRQAEREEKRESGDEKRGDSGFGLDMVEKEVADFFILLTFFGSGGVLTEMEGSVVCRREVTLDTWECPNRENQEKM